MFRLREETARTTCHLDDLVAWDERGGEGKPWCVQMRAEGTNNVIQLLRRQ